MPQANPLVNQSIVRVWLADDNGAIKFDLASGESIIARADGDCCSHTWIQDIDIPENLLGLVRSVEDIPMPDLGSPDEYEVIAYYGCKIITDRGSVVIDYRNESNGYYGGNLHWPVAEGDYDSFYGGVYGQNISKMQWKLIAGQSDPSTLIEDKKDAPSHND